MRVSPANAQTRYSHERPALVPEARVPHRLGLLPNSSTPLEFEAGLAETRESEVTKAERLRVTLLRQVSLIDVRTKSKGFAQFHLREKSCQEDSTGEPPRSTLRPSSTQNKKEKEKKGELGENSVR